MRKTIITLAAAVFAMSLGACSRRTLLTRKYKYGVYHDIDHKDCKLVLHRSTVI